MVMIAIGKVTQALLKGDFRQVMAIIKGTSGARNAYEVTPYGIDSNPIKDVRNVYCTTLNTNEQVSIGYILKHRDAAPGETYVYSTDTSGTIKFRIKLKADGTCEMGGNTKHMVRYEELETAFNELKSKFNSLVTLYNTHVHSGGTISGSTGTPSTGTGTSSTADISPAKINEIKTL